MFRAPPEQGHVAQIQLVGIGDQPDERRVEPGVVFGEQVFYE
jgi:hypothetical protein